MLSCHHPDLSRRSCLAPLGTTTVSSRPSGTFTANIWPGWTPGGTEMLKRVLGVGKLPPGKTWEKWYLLMVHPNQLTSWGKGSWAVLKRSFISQGRKELLTQPLTRPQCQLTRGDSCILLTLQLMLTYHLRVLLTPTFLWPPPFLLQKGWFIAWFSWNPSIYRVFWTWKTAVAVTVTSIKFTP